MSNDNECAMCHEIKPDENTLFDEKENCHVCRICLMNVWVEKAMASLLSKGFSRVLGADRMRAQFYGQALRNFDKLKAEQQKREAKELSDLEKKTLAAYEELKAKKPEAEKLIQSGSKPQ